MKLYGNPGGNSGVAYFEDGPDFIKLMFNENDDVVYVYDHVVPGQIVVTRMKALAVAGKGLSTYVSQHVRGSYHRKEFRDGTEAT